MTNYYQCDVCDKTMSQNDAIPKFEATGVTYLCYKCLNPTEFAFSACTIDSPEPSLGFCDGCDECDELEAELHLVDGDWICDKCKAAVTAVQEDKAKAQKMKSIAIDTRHYSEDDLQDLEKGYTDHWDMVKAYVFVTLFAVWVCFALWGKYVS